MKRYLAVAMVVVFVLGFAGVAMAQGNFYISGSADNIGGLGQDGKSFDKVHINNRIVFEGPTSDTYEGTIVVSDPGSDLIWTMPATSGTMAITSSLFNTTLEDGKVLIGNFSDEAIAYTPSGAWTITNAGVSTLGLNSVSAASMVAANVVDSSEINDNAVGTAQANVNTVSVTIPTASTQGTATVTTGSTLLGAPYGVANIQFLAINGITNASITGTTLTLITNGTTGTNAVVYKAVVLEP